MCYQELQLCIHFLPPPNNHILLLLFSNLRLAVEEKSLIHLTNHHKPLKVYTANRCASPYSITLLNKEQSPCFDD